MKGAFIAAAAVGVLLLPAQLAAQQWIFQGYHEGKPWGQGTMFRLIESAPGQYKVRFISAEGLDDCHRRERRASVDLQADQQIVVLHPPMHGCREYRFVLKTDGSGGRVEYQQPDGSWQWDGNERNFKRK